MIQIESPTAGQIGDALIHIPFMAWMCQKHESPARISHMNRLVAEVLGPSYPFDYGPLDPSKPMIRMNIHEVLNLGLHGSHMMQSFFRHYKEPEPLIPATLDLREENCGLEPGLVVSPFSRSNSPNNNKFWPNERWIDVINTLRKEGAAGQAYVLGSLPDDDMSMYAAHGIKPVVNRPLAQVLHLIRQAPVFLSIDNGIAHLAHFGGVHHHVQLYPGCTPRCWAQNPRAIHVSAPMPINVQVADILRGARQVLSTQ